MNILEEYIQRKNLQNLSVVHHCYNTFAIAKPSVITTSNTYLYISISWNNRTKSPGNYFIEFKYPQKIQYPILNSIRNDEFVSHNTLFKTLSSQKIEYDDYEDFIYSWYYAVKKSNSNWIFANSKEDARFMLWESFVYMFDLYFLEVPHNIKSLLWESLNLKNSLEKRIQSINEIVNHISLDSRSMCSIWFNAMLVYLKSYSAWIGKLFADKSPCRLEFNN